jgi:hypothetical protein
LSSGGSGIRFGELLFDGLTVNARIVRARARERDESGITLNTRAADCA